jgi:hypothetical protein
MTLDPYLLRKELCNHKKETREEECFTIEQKQSFAPINSKKIRNIFETISPLTGSRRNKNSLCLVLGPTGISFPKLQIKI